MKNDVNISEDEPQMVRVAIPKILNYSKNILIQIKNE